VPVGESRAPRILVADDVGDLTDALLMLFQLEGYETEAARDGWECLEKVLAFRPDIVILDHAMPRLSGCDAARAIRNRPETSRIKIVMNTATAEPDVRAIFSDYDAYHPKTADPERLLRTVNLLIGGGRSTARRA